MRTQSSITPGNGGTISGSQLAYASVTLESLATFGVLFPDSNSGDVSLEPNQTRTLDPGPYGALIVKSQSTVLLRSGTYSFESVDLEPGSHLSADRLNGPVYVYVRTRLSHKGQIDAPAGPAADFFIGYLGTETAFIESPFIGTIAAPSAMVVLGASGSAGHQGSFFARDLEVYPDVVVRQLAFPYPWVQ